MSKSEDYIRSVLEPFGPKLPLAELVRAVNALYHAAEAPHYDAEHFEVFQQLPPIWREALRALQERRGTSAWRVVDFGCGTGFEARQLLANVPREAIESLTCYDPAPEMLERCRRHVRPLYPSARFTSSLDEVMQASGGCNVVLTNSVLHHLPEPAQTMVAVGARAAVDAAWLAGHEPSRRFYRNAECVDVYRRYARFHRWHRFLTPRNYVKALDKLVRRREWPAEAAARAAYTRGYFKRPPKAAAIDRLVDLHVANSVEEAQSGRGFDIETLRQQLRPTWELAWSKTYSFLGPIYEGRAPLGWRRKCQVLATKFPLDGATFISIWERAR
jgi:trans-aconitate methyltransferase